MNRIIHFEIGADDPERAARFYADVLGWQLQKWEGGETDYWLITTGPADQPGINGGLFRNGNMTGVVNTVDVESVDQAVAAVTAHGGQVVAPKMAIPGTGYLAYCRDTEGNMFGMMQSDPAAH